MIVNQSDLVRFIDNDDDIASTPLLSTSACPLDKEHEDDFANSIQEVTLIT